MGVGAIRRLAAAALVVGCSASGGASPSPPLPSIDGGLSAGDGSASSDSSVPSHGGGLPITGQAFWREGCHFTMKGPQCSNTSHLMRGSARSPELDVTCSVFPTTGGTSITFRFAAIEPGQNFSESQEGLFATGILGAVGSELRPGDDGGFMQIRGAGWSIPPSNGTNGVTGVCHVFIDRLSGQGFSGRVKCDGVRDDLSPPRQRYVAGLEPQTQSTEFGESSLTNCANTR